MAASSESPPVLLARRCHVSGRVQGVYYRASAAQRARTLKLTGHARNLPDGRVEVLVYGSEHAVLAFIEWLWIGPSAARVRDVAVTVLEAPPTPVPSEFTTG
jgi:acylphosphatase